MQRFLSPVIVLAVLLGLIAPAAARGGDPDAANPVAALTWFDEYESGGNGMVFWQQVGTTLAARGLIIGLPADAQVVLRVQRGTCEAPGAVVLRARAAVESDGAAVVRVRRTVPEGALLSLDDGQGAVRLVADGEVLRCHDLVVWPKASVPVPELGLTGRSETTVSGVAFLRARGGSDVRAMVFIQQDVTEGPEFGGFWSVVDGAPSDVRVTLCDRCADPARRFLLGTVGTVGSANTELPAGTLAEVGAAGGRIRLSTAGSVVSAGPLRIYSLSNDEQFPN